VVADDPMRCKGGHAVALTFTVHSRVIDNRSVDRHLLAWWEAAPAQSHLSRIDRLIPDLDCLPCGLRCLRLLNPRSESVENRGTSTRPKVHKRTRRKAAR